ncbi:hypothetical protein LX15_000717 [Streptoalloteichus tenebrarius]|uniref:Uncharacterized protein n=1 Tax=Streptoalloteichus tenebrarius (strain ATCC 17920 / DSM 40477 / JCM 4838 / CBS 697.72 / NBRC 16177 / NCIMB 11028 / NRRL B-12390 / A12253. 1 / ISP 5477) TaxID=1933 RepID=A0ABT1HNE3_STRSD|nr:hypothetical protein [Streptoalloteichus tenebrarius]MCP2257034.1 hypothetical protein [Streptoalloteichus tenebrarius]BFF00056.1 hypothetical protein GCM10020241_17310 [Streptoalloteichus tenebrarius]
MFREGDRCRLVVDLPLTEDCWLPAGLEGTVQRTERVIVFGPPPPVADADGQSLRRAYSPRLRVDVQCRVRLDTGGFVTAWAHDQLERL